MPPTPGQKANYKTYEAQARMVRAIVAAHPDVKWNYKEIAACYGSDMTEHALNHRFRRLRAQATIVREARLQDLDMKLMMNVDELPTTKEAVDKNNIARYFGQSTPDGIQFQFRAVKKDAETLRKVEAAGGDVATCLGTSAAGTASVTTPSSSKTTPSRSLAPGSRSSTSRKRTRLPNSRRNTTPDATTRLSDLELTGERANLGASDDSWSATEETTPSKRPRAGLFRSQMKAMPRRAAQQASSTIADALTHQQDSDSAATVEETTSLFGQIDPRHLHADVGRADVFMGATLKNRCPSDGTVVGQTVKYEADSDGYG